MQLLNTKTCGRVNIPKDPTYNFCVVKIQSHFSNVLGNHDNARSNLASLRYPFRNTAAHTEATPTREGI